MRWRIDAVIGHAMQAREILERIRGTSDIGMEFDDIKMAAEIANSVRSLIVAL